MSHTLQSMTNWPLIAANRWFAPPVNFRDTSGVSPAVQPPAPKRRTGSKARPESFRFRMLFAPTEAWQRRNAGWSFVPQRSVE